MNLRKVYYSLPPFLRYLIRRVYYLPIDFYNGMTGKRSPYEPPKGLNYTGSGNFIEQGKTFFNYFRKYGRLQSSHRVLDIGCGMGRMAVPLIDFLDKDGSYEGFDVVEKGIHWCKKKISPAHPNFNFQFVPLHNDLYTPGHNNSVNFRFPYDSDEFDFCIVTSVFTHMLPEEVENYLSEINRVLKPGGRCLATFFILDEESQRLSESTGSFPFKYHYGNYSLMDKEVKSANVAFDKNYLVKEVLPQKTNLQIEQFLPGRWCGRKRENSVDFQDILILKKNWD